MSGLINLCEYSDNNDRAVTGRILRDSTARLYAHIYYTSTGCAPTDEIIRDLCVFKLPKTAFGVRLEANDGNSNNQ